MEFASAFILAIVQGILEWFPVSSSGHLVLFEKILYLDDGLALQVALHFGTLMAIFVYFRKDIIFIFRDILEGKWNTDNARLGFLLLVASIPVFILGLFIGNLIDSMGGNLLLLGFGWVVTSTVLFVGSYSPKKNLKLNWKKALLIGISQVFALLPGVSRSGMTISSGLLFGMDEKNSLKFSYLLSIPVILGASIVTFGNKTIPFEYLFPTIICFVLGLIFTKISFNYVLNNRKNLRWFGIYTFILGVIIILSQFIN